MKTIIKKTLAVIFLLMLLSNISYSYRITVIKPKPCPDNPSFLHFPSFTQQCEFIIDSWHAGDSDTILYKIVIEQNGNSLEMAEGVSVSGETVYRTINLQNFTQLCFNEVAAIRIDAKRFDGGGVTYTERGYLIVYKNELSCKYSSITSGSTQLITPSYIPVTFYSRCGTLSSSIYYLKRYKKTLTLYGDFRDSVPVIEQSLCLGYSGAGPNNQQFWAAKIDSSDNHVTFITFVYEGYNILGQYMDWWPCRPEQATVVFKYVTKPKILNHAVYPNNPSPQNNIAFVTCNLLQGNGNLTYQWRDSNGTQFPVQLYGFGNWAKFIVNFSGTNNQVTEDTAYFVFTRVVNEAGLSEWKKRKITFSRTVNNCPIIEFKIDDTKIIENAILNQSFSKQNQSVKDFVLLENTFLRGDPKIEFELNESKNDVTELDFIGLSQVISEKNEQVAVDNDGHVITYILKDEKTKILKNEDEDVSRRLSYKDEEEVALKKDDKLTISYIPDGSGYVILIARGPPKKIDKAAIITSDEGFSDTVFIRDNISTVCLKIDGSTANEFQFKAEQDLTIDVLTFVSEQKKSEVKPLKMESAFSDKYGNVMKKLSKFDGDVVYIEKNNGIHFSFGNEDVPEAKSVHYIVSTAGRILKHSSDKTEKIDNWDQKEFQSKLFENSPNPFNPVTNIKYEIRVDGFVNLKIYDISGRVVNTIVNEYKEAGRYEVTFDGSNLASGIYFYRIETDGFRDTKRMILVK